MDRDEIARELREMSQYYEADAETFDAAIALIEPQPVTEAGLREAGFEYKPLESLYCTKVGVWLVAVCVKDVVTVWLQPPSGPDEELHITDMQTLRSVIAALRGRELNSEPAMPGEG